MKELGLSNTCLSVVISQRCRGCVSYLEVWCIPLVPCLGPQKGDISCSQENGTVKSVQEEMGWFMKRDIHWFLRREPGPGVSGTSPRSLASAGGRPVPNPHRPAHSYNCCLDRSPASSPQLYSISDPIPPIPRRPAPAFDRALEVPPTHVAQPREICTPFALSLA